MFQSKNIHRKTQNQIQLVQNRIGALERQESNLERAYRMQIDRVCQIMDVRKNARYEKSVLTDQIKEHVL